MERSFVFIGNSSACVPIAQHLVDEGYACAMSLEEADVVFTLCTNANLLEDVYFEGNGIIANARPGTLAIDLSPASHSLSRSISEMATVSGLNFVAAPIALRDYMHPQGFSDRSNLIAFAGTSEEFDLDEAMPLLENIVDEVDCCEGVEAAQISKHALTMQMGAQIAALMEAEALSLAANANHPVGTVFDAIDMQGFAVSENLASFARALTMKDFRGEDGLTVEMLLADIQAVLQSAEDANLVIPHVESLNYLLDLLAHVGGADLTPAALILVYCDEEAGQAYGLDWTRVQGGHDHDCECGCGHDHDDHGCECGHDHGHDSHDCGCGHDHDHGCCCGHDELDGFEDDDVFGYGDPFAEFGLSDPLSDEYDDFPSR